MELRSRPGGRGVTSLEGCEGARIQAKLDADMELLEKMLDDRLVYTHGSGLSDTKSEYLAKIREGAAIYHSGRSEIRRIIHLGETALMYARVTMEATIAALPKRIDSAVLLVWTRESGDWRLVAHQPTVLAATA